MTINKAIAARNKAIADALRREYEKEQRRHPQQAITHLAAVRELALSQRGVIAILKKRGELHMLDA